MLIFIQYFLLFREQGRSSRGGPNLLKYQNMNSSVKKSAQLAPQLPDSAGRRVLVALSGGIDSAVAALRLQEAGYTLYGATMRLSPAGSAAACLQDRDIADARAFCARLGIPYELIDLQADFAAQVIRPFAEAYESGETPNPCVLCNHSMKFGALYAAGAARGFDKIATGHYVRSRCDAASGRWLLARGRDPAKDQSYVLWQLSQEQLAHTIFPLGGLAKSEVRAAAEAAGFPHPRKAESQDICFIPDGDYAAFLERWRGKSYAPGPFILRDGTVIGQHRGLIAYTVGQRKGLGIAWSEPLYVLEKRPAENSIVLGPAAELYVAGLLARDINLIAVSELNAPRHVLARCRYHQAELPGTVEQVDAGHFRLHFDTPQKAIARGQSVVLYEGDLVLGGGIIDGTF